MPFASSVVQNTGMVGFTALIAAIALQPSTETYTPARHTQFIRTSFASSEKAMNDYAGKKSTKAATAAKLGKAMGENRRYQVSLNFYMQQMDKKEGTTVLRTIQWAGTYDAYLTSQILGLEGDGQSREFAKILGNKLRQWASAKK